MRIIDQHTRKFEAHEGACGGGAATVGEGNDHLINFFTGGYFFQLSDGAENGAVGDGLAKIVTAFIEKADDFQIEFRMSKDFTRERNASVGSANDEDPP